MRTDVGMYVGSRYFCLKFGFNWLTVWLHFSILQASHFYIMEILGLRMVCRVMSGGLKIVGDNNSVYRLDRKIW